MNNQNDHRVRNHSRQKRLRSKGSKPRADYHFDKSKYDFDLCD